MNEMIERMARAMFDGRERYGAAGATLWDKAHPEAKDIFRTHARAALAALRQPTAAMKRAGGNADGDHGNAAVETWEIMIDAALSDG